MLKSRAAYDQSVQRTTCAICGRRLTLVIVNSVVRAEVAADLKSTSKCGNRVGCAGGALMSHESSLLVVAGPDAMPAAPNGNVAFGAVTSLPPAAKADPAISREAVIARTKSFFILLLSYTRLLRTTDSNGYGVTLSRRYDHLPRQILSFSCFSVVVTVWPNIREVNTRMAILWGYAIRAVGKFARSISEPLPQTTTNYVIAASPAAPPRAALSIPREVRSRRAPRRHSPHSTSIPTFISTSRRATRAWRFVRPVRLAFFFESRDRHEERRIHAALRQPGVSLLRI